MIDIDLINKVINSDEPTIRFDVDLDMDKSTLDRKCNFTYGECLTLKKLDILKRRMYLEVEAITFDYTYDWKINITKAKRKVNIDTVIDE